jgi:hypothetical protein
MDGITVAVLEPTPEEAQTYKAILQQQEQQNAQSQGSAP